MFHDVKEVILRFFMDNWGDSNYVFANDNTRAFGGGSWVFFDPRLIRSDQRTIGQVGGRRFQNQGVAILQTNTSINLGTEETDRLLDRFKRLRGHNAAFFWNLVFGNESLRRWNRWIAFCCYGFNSVSV